MGYLSLLISLLAGSTKGFFGKKVSSYVSTQKQSAFVNAVRMVLCVLISLAVLAVQSSGEKLSMDRAAWIYGALAGVMLSVFMVTWVLAVRRGAFMLISVTQMFGVVVTLLCAAVVFKTPFLPRQIVGVGLLIAAVLLMGSYSASLKGKLDLTTVVLLVLCGLSSGFYDFSLKLFREFSEAKIASLNLISYAISAVVLTAAFLVPTKEPPLEAKSLLRKTILPLLVMSACLFLNSYFKTLANDDLSPAQVYPIYQAGGLILSAVMSAAFFKERITLRCIIGMALAFVSILLLK